MSARLTRFDFDQGDAFELPPRFERRELETRFADLKEELLNELLEETETLDLHTRTRAPKPSTPDSGAD